MQSTIDKLKEKPKEQKNAVAGGVAVTVVAVLLIGWGFFYLKKVLGERPPADVSTTSTIDFGAIRDFTRDAAAIGRDTRDDDPYAPESSNSSTDPFGTPRNF